jgi:hypothetical protein
MRTDMSDYPYGLFSSTFCKESTGIICKKKNQHVRITFAVNGKHGTCNMAVRCMLVGEELNKCFPSFEEEPEDDDENMAGNKT